MELLREKGLDDVLVVVGGIIPDVDIPKLQGARRSQGCSCPARRCRTSSTSSPRTSGRASSVDGPMTPSPSATRPCRKLLLADDSVTVQRVIELTFADEDMRSWPSATATQAIARLDADPPDIVLADVGMPERDGYEVAAFVKATPRWRTSRSCC